MAGLDQSKIPAWQFTGNTLPYMIDDDIWESWNRWHDHHLPLVAGGQMDQPAGWLEAMELCDAIYNTLLEQAHDEKERTTPQPGGDRRPHLGQRPKL